MLRHLHVLRGLGMLSIMRIKEYREAVRDLAIDSVDSKADDMAIRNQLRIHYMKGELKARMLLDEFREIDAYIIGPTVLYLCMAQALVERHRRLKRDCPELALPILDQYLQQYSSVFDAVQSLRNWALHSSHFVPEERVIKELFQGKGQSGERDPLGVVATTFELFQQLLEKIDETAKQMD